MTIDKDVAGYETNLYNCLRKIPSQQSYKKRITGNGSRVIMATAFAQSDSLTSSRRPQFVESLPEKYKCPVCHRVLLKPLQTLCGHHVCEECLNTLFDEASSNGVETVPCPAKTEECEALVNDNQSVVPDHRFRKEMLQLEVFCFNKENGCSYKGKWNYLKTHLGECEFHLQDCKYRKDGCPEKLLLKDFKDHVESDCKYIPEKCQYCQRWIPKIKMQEHHTSECEDFSMPCPFGCGEDVKRKLISSHREVCRQKPSKCTFAPYGCRHEGSIEQLKEHEASATAYHLRLMADNPEKPQAQVKHVQRVDPRTQEFIQALNRQQVDQQKSLVQATSKLMVLERFVRDIMVQQKRVKDEVIKVMQAETTLSDRVASVESSRDGLTEEKVNQIEDRLGRMEINVANLEERIVTMEDACYDGILIWKIDDYYKEKEDAKNGVKTNLTSPPFYSSRRGYKMCCRAYLYGDGQGHKTHMSLFFVVMKGKYDAILKWPFQQRVTLQLLDQTNRTHLEDSFKPDVSSSSFQRPVNREMNVASGCPLFAAHSTIEKENAGFIGKDKCIFIRVIVQPTVDKDDSRR